jgi:antitoxin component of MazEF toxin-antitoxin module
MKFSTTILQSGNNTGIVVPPEVVEALSGGKKPAVTVTIGSYSYRSSVAVMGGQFLIPLSAERRAESGIKGGDAIEVELTLDTEPREVVVPEDLSVALAGDAAAKAFFETLSYSNKLRHVLSITDAKTPETRQKRIDKAMDMLRSGKK